MKGGFVLKKNANKQAGKKEPMETRKKTKRNQKKTTTTTTTQNK